MVKESRERITNSLRDKIRANAREETQDLLRRARDIVKSSPAHPRHAEISQMVENLEGRIDEADEHELQNMADSLMRVVSEVEAAS